MKAIISVIIWLVASYFSRQYAAGYWVVGPVFGAALLVYNRARVFKSFTLRHLFLFLASVFVYALVYLIAAKGWKFKNDWLDMLAGGTTGGVIVGSILMPALHAMLFPVDAKMTRSVSLKLIASWYITLLISKVLETAGFEFRIDFLWISIAAWQGIYLKYLKI